MRTNSRSVTFPPIAPDPNKLGTPDPNKLGAQAPAGPNGLGNEHQPFARPIEDRQQVSVYGDMVRDAHLISIEVKRIPFDEDGLHGRVQVILSAARRLQDSAKAILSDLEGDGK